MKVNYEYIVLGCGGIGNGAGHAYKFASLLGKILSQLAIDHQSEYPIAPFSLQRPAIVDPNYQATFHI